MLQDSLTWICRMRGHIQSVLPETVLYPVSAHRLPTIVICSKFDQLPSFPHVFFIAISLTTHLTESWINRGIGELFQKKYYCSPAVSNSQEQSNWED